MHRLTLAFACTLTALPAAAETTRIVALGDMPYGEPAEVYPAFEALIGAVNAADPALVIHIGDTKSGSTPCSDAMLAEQRDYLNSFAAPVIYTPGDNEWTDCHREAAGGFDPLDRLARIRETYFADPAQSMGAEPVAVESQAEAGYPENTRLRIGGLLVVAVHVVGSNNNFEIRDPTAADEFFARNAAGLDWLDASFAAGGDAAAAIVAIHADMFEGGYDAGDESWARHSGFADFGPALQQAAAGFGKPVLLIYGDSHVFKVDRPFPETAPALTALEVFGAEDMHAVEITADTGTPSVFAIRPLMNPALAPGG